MKEALVSVIIPAYNAGSTLKRCVGSCLAQTYANLEIIIIDDGSTDGTWQTALSLRQEDNRVVPFHTENRGVSAARNTGIEKSSGEYLFFLDADDAIAADAVQTLLDLLTAQAADIAVGQLKTVRQAPAADVPAENTETFLWTETQALEALLRDNPSTYSSCGKLYSRSTIGKTRFAQGRKIHEDSFFLFELFLRLPRVAVTNRAVYLCYPEQNSAGRSPYSDRMLDILYFAKEKKRLIDAQYPMFSDLAHNVLIKADLAYLSFCSLHNAKGAAQTEKACIREVKQLKRYYIPMTAYQNKLFFAVTHHLYYPLKLFQSIRNRHSS